MKHHLDYEETILNLGDEPEDPRARRFYNYIKAKIEKRITKPKTNYMIISTPHQKRSFMSFCPNCKWWILEKCSYEGKKTFDFMGDCICFKPKVK